MVFNRLDFARRRPLAYLLVLSCLLVGPPSAAADEDFDVRPGYTVIDSIPQLQQAVRQSDQKIRMKPGVYRVPGAWPDDPQSVFIVSGSNNHFDLRGVSIEVPTEIYRDMRGRVHALAGYRIQGDHNTFEGATFENVGDHPPHRSLPEFAVHGDGNRFVDCRFIIRGSAPYGYGDMYGKGGGSVVRLQKHSAMQVRGDDTLIENCEFRVYTFGHGIFMQGAQDTTIRNVLVEGEIRHTDEIYRETSGPAAEHDHKIMFPEWQRGQPIPRDAVVHLAEDGIRAYNRGSRNGTTRRTGKITVEDSTVKRMRGGISITAAGEAATVTGTRAIDCRHGFSLPNGGVVRNSAGNVAFGPLVFMPYSQKRSADIELELIGSDHDKGDHVLAGITGRGHRIRITAPEGYEPETVRPIVVGESRGGNFTGRWSEQNSSADELQRRHRAHAIRLINQTPHPVKLKRYSANCEVDSHGHIRDEGEGNQTNAAPR